jgi:hypothetical protein
LDIPILRWHWRWGGGRCNGSAVWKTVGERAAPTEGPRLGSGPRFRLDKPSMPSRRMRLLLTAPRPTRRPMHAARHPAGGRCPHRWIRAVPMPRPLQHPMTSRRWSCGTAGRRWRTIGTSAGSRISYMCHHWTVTQPGGVRAPAGQAGPGSDTGAAGERDKQVTSPRTRRSGAPRWAMHAGPAAASSRVGETGPPGPGLMRSPDGVSVRGGRCLTFGADVTVS